MGVVRKIRSKGLNITVESHAEVLFMPGGPVHNWANRLTGRIRSRTIAAAPSNKRPRWAHYGKPLKGTIKSARPRFWGNGRDKQRVYAAVGSSAPHAYYVDQGTGIHNGSGPYPAKILPPWLPGSPSLYEHTWRPNGPGHRKVAPVMIQGQKGQFFFEKGLAAAFRSMRLRSFQVPGEGGPTIGGVLGTTPTGMTNFFGNTPSDGAFKAQLEEWREWRDDAWDRGEGLGRAGGLTSKSQQKWKRDIAAAREARLAEQGKGLGALRAINEAAEKRKQEQEASIRLAEQRRREKEEREREDAAKELQAQKEREAERKVRAGNADMKRRAEEALRMLKGQYPDARLAIASPDADGAIVYTIRYTDASGDRHTVQWGYGYTD